MSQLDDALHGLFQKELHLARCGFLGCILEAFHDGDHQPPLPVAAAKSKLPVHHCIVCGLAFVVYGEEPRERLHFQTCGQPGCILHFARHEAAPAPLLCPCLQRPYPHELSVHRELRPESYNPKRRGRWPWALCQSPRVELSAERRPV